MKLSEICLVNTWSDRFTIKGQLSLIHVDDTVHVIEYKDSERSIAVDIDLIELREHDKTVRFTFPRGSNDRLIFKIEDQLEFSVLTQAREDCQAICDMKLRLNSILRDSYYSGIYSNLDPDAKLVLGDEIDRMKKENPGVFFSSLLNTRLMRYDNTSNPSHKTKNEDSTSVGLADVQCVFCDASKLIHKELDFFIHPNVPTKSDGKNIYMCSICIENWKEYREIAEHEDQLILEGEINEEICAICSDTPSTLVLCSNCPRSYCNNCLQRILTKQEENELTMNPDADWLCMCCNTGFSDHPVLCRTVWKMIVPCSGRRGLHYGTIVPYGSSSRTTQHTLSNNNNNQPATEDVNKGLSNDAIKLKSSLETGIPLDVAVARTATAASVPLLLSLTSGKNTVSTPKSLERRPSISTADEDTSPRASSRRHPRQSTGTGSSNGTVRPQKGRRHQTQYDIEDVIPERVLQNQNKLASSSNNRQNRMEKRYAEQSLVVELGGVSGSRKQQLASGFVQDEKYYFSQYVCYYDLLCQEVSRRSSRNKAVAGAIGISSPKRRGRGGGGVKRKHREEEEEEEIPTDDVCFLCKDGGDLIECDWRCASAKHGERCLKVYHTYCLDFEVSDEKWCCPRHYCDMCGHQTLKYICKYCPVSLCANCPEKFVKTYGQSRYCLVSDELSGSWGHSPTAPGVQTIVCQTCTEMLEGISNTSSISVEGTATTTVAAEARDVVKGSASMNLVRKEIQKEKRFPGKYSTTGKLGTCSIYLKDTSDSFSSSGSSSKSIDHPPQLIDMASDEPATVTASVAEDKPEPASGSNDVVAVEAAAAGLSEDSEQMTGADTDDVKAQESAHATTTATTTVTTTTVTTTAAAGTSTAEEIKASFHEVTNRNNTEEHVLDNKQSSAIEHAMERNGEISAVPTISTGNSTDKQMTHVEEIKEKESTVLVANASDAQERGLVSADTAVEQLPTDPSEETKPKGSTRKRRQKEVHSSDQNTSTSNSTSDKSDSSSCNNISSNSSSSSSTTNTSKIVVPLPRSRAKVQHNSSSSTASAAASSESTSAKPVGGDRSTSNVTGPTTGTSGIRSAEASSPPKKRAASSAAMHNISMQLKGMTRPTATTTAAPVKVASVEGRSSVSTGTAIKAAAGVRKTPAAIKAAEAAVATRTKSSIAATTVSDVAKRENDKSVDADSEDDEEEVVIHIAKRVTRRDVAASIAGLPLLQATAVPAAAEREASSTASTTNSMSNESSTADGASSTVFASTRSSIRNQGGVLSGQDLLPGLL